MIESLKKLFFKWWKILLIILSPGSAIFIIISFFSLYFSIINKENYSLSNTLAVLAAVSGAVGGGFIKDEYEKSQNSTILEKKGRSAVRNLEAIGQQANRICHFIKSLLIKDDDDPNTRNFREISRHIETMTMQINSGAEDWIDIVPELKRNEEVIKKSQEVIKSYVEEILNKKKELISAGENEELKKQLEKKIKELEKNIGNIEKKQEEVVNRGFDGSIGVIPSASGFSSSKLYMADLNPKKCSKCGKYYTNEPSLLGSTVLYFSDLCPDCRKNIVNSR